MNRPTHRRGVPFRTAAAATFACAALGLGACSSDESLRSTSTSTVREPAGAERTTTTVATAPNGQPLQGPAESPSLSADGKLMAFCSSANNWVGVVSGSASPLAEASVGIAKAAPTARATAAVKYFGGDDLVAYLNTTLNMQGVPIGNDPVLFKFFAKMGESLGEDKLKGTLGLGVAPQEAQDKITAILADKNHAYHNRFAAGHEEAVAMVRKLFEAAYPGESK